MTDFRFGTKGETLARLAPSIIGLEFCPQVLIDRTSWRRDRTEMVRNVLESMNGNSLAVRSSALNEDSENDSLAGVNLSLIGVRSTPQDIMDAVDQVFGSYKGPIDRDQVLIQPQVKDTNLSGVVLTRDLDTGSPYYVISYDDMTGRTDTVTGGGVSKELRVRRDYVEAVSSPRLRKLLEGIQQIEEQTNCDTLDIEFCVTKDDRVFILQVRPLAARRQWVKIEDGDVSHELDNVRDAVEAEMAPRQGLHGDTTIFGEMPDWNPAEMIGNAPRPLALSVYKRLITDRTWLHARIAMGYRGMADTPLMVSFAGRPYIDVRRSFNSFLPDGLEDGFAGRLINYQLESLKSHRELHDKIEFEIALTCRTFDMENRFREMGSDGFTSGECESLNEALGKLTNQALGTFPDGLTLLEAQTRTLKGRNTKDLPEDTLSRAAKMLSQCTENGVAPFAILARHSFIGVSLLRSLVARGGISEDEADMFFKSVHTVTADIVHDLHELSAGKIDQESVLARYGHLRPGSYDITSWRYDARPELYFGKSLGLPTTAPKFELSLPVRKKIEVLLEAEGYDIGPEQLFGYISKASEMREAAKFMFSRNLSDALEEIADWGARNDLDREALSYLTIDEIFAGLPRDDLEARISAARKAHSITLAIHLPHLIVDPVDIDVSRYPLARPNFITRRTVTDRTCVLRQNEAPDIDGAIVFIESADPGFDWVFSHRINGLITKYGGANSHMAIRCAEFGIPAAIGAGERLYERFANAQIVELNCGARTIRTLR
jgi:phosphohistidine swiveling domain-containing protein